MVTPNTILITETEIIKLRDQMPITELRAITNKVLAEQGYVNFREIFKAMGYTHAFNNKWYIA